MSVSLQVSLFDCSSALPRGVLPVSVFIKYASRSALCALTTARQGQWQIGRIEGKVVTILDEEWIFLFLTKLLHPRHTDDLPPSRDASW